MCRLVGCEVVVVEPADTDPRKSLADDVPAILTVFGAMCNGMRSHSNQRAIAGAMGRSKSFVADGEQDMESAGFRTPAKCRLHQGNRISA